MLYKKVNKCWCPDIYFPFESRTSFHRRKCGMSHALLTDSLYWESKLSTDCFDLRFNIYKFLDRPIVFRISFIWLKIKKWHVFGSGDLPVCRSPREEISEQSKSFLNIFWDLFWKYFEFLFKMSSEKLDIFFDISSEPIICFKSIGAWQDLQFAVSTMFTPS